MIITFDEARDDGWLNRCLMCSLTNEAIESGREKREFDVKLLVNGIELEPKLLGDLLKNVEKYIDNEAKELANEKLKTSLLKVRKLEEMIDEVCYKIRDEFEVEIPTNE